MTDISCKGAGSWSVIEGKKWIQDFLCNSFLSFFLFFFERAADEIRYGGKRGEKAAATRIIKCLTAFNSSRFCY